MEIIPFTAVVVGLQNCLRDWTLGICQRGLMHILLSFNGYSAGFRPIKIRLSHCLFSHLWGLGSPALSARSQLLLLHTAFSGSFIWICSVTQQDLREGDFVVMVRHFFFDEALELISFLKRGALWVTGSISYTHTDVSSWDIYENPLFIHNPIKNIYIVNTVNIFLTIELNTAQGMYEKAITTFISLIENHMFNY